MKKKHWIQVIGVILIVAICASLAIIANGAETDGYKRTTVISLFSDDEILDYWQEIDAEEIEMQISYDMAQNAKLDDTEKAVCVNQEKEVEFVFQLPEDGEYLIALEYKYLEKSLSQNNAVCTINGQRVTSPLYSLWKDETKVYEHDMYDNELNPTQEMLDLYNIEYLTDFSSLDRSPCVFSMKKGENRITITSELLSFYLKNIYVLNTQSASTYEDYLVTHKGENDEVSCEPIIIEAEDYRLKSDSYIHSASTKNLDVTPNALNQKLLNVLDGGSFDSYGSKVLWEFEIKESGYYSISFFNNQSYASKMSVFRDIEIDGNTLFEEMNAVEFPYTGYSGYMNTDFAIDGKPAKIWLSEGKHTIALKTSSKEVQDITEKINDIMLQINSIGMEIKKMTGNQSDANRTWEIEEYMPNLKEDLKDISENIKEVKEESIRIFSEEPAYVSTLNYAVDNINKLLKEPKKIPSKLELLSEGTGSVTQILGDIISTLSESPLTIDKIYIYPAGTTVDNTSASVWDKITTSIQRFFYSFTEEASEGQYSTSKKKDGAVNVWVNRSIQYIQVLQTMTEEFTRETGIKVNISMMPNEQKLILANATDVNPDVAIGITHTMPYDLAIRGVAKDLTEYDGFIEWYNSEFNIESLAPMCYEDGVYGVSETQNFMILFYRKDILDELGIEVPDTWDDVKEIMPVLHRYGMNFSIPASNVLGYKAFFATAPFIYQNNGEIYSPDGYKTAIDSENTIHGFGELTDLYTIYAMSAYVPDFYNAFRYGTIPIGVSDFGSYLKIMYAAPEIREQWGVAVAPGTVNENGEVERYQLANLTAGMIFEDTDMPEESYEFLKWWMSKETQIDYAYRMEQTYGPEFKWNTANVEAFKELNYPQEVKDVILEQWKWNKEVYRHPATYMVERELSMAYNDVVINGLTVQESIDKATLITNREFKRKLQEFGYVDENGNLIAEYPINSIERLKETLEESEE